MVDWWLGCYRVCRLFVSFSHVVVHTVRLIHTADCVHALGLDRTSIRGANIKVIYLVPGDRQHICSVLCCNGMRR